MLVASIGLRTCLRCTGVHVLDTVFSAGARVLEEGGPWAVLGAHGERVEREPITGVWGQSPQWGPGAKPLVWGEAPLKLKAFLALGHATDRANLYLLQYFQQSIIIR